MSDRRRLDRTIDYWLGKTGLDLRGHTLLTEAATGTFAAMPAVALRAGADRVIAWGRDSSYGKAAEAVAGVRAVLQALGISEERVDFAENARPPEHLKECNLVANAGHVRPLDRAFLGQLRPGTVIGLMYDGWELREEDLDLPYCRERGLRVAGVDEAHQSLEIFSTCGLLGLKMSFAAGFSVAHDRIFVYSDDAFGRVIGDAFRTAGAAEVEVSTDVEMLKQTMEQWDFVFLCRYREERPLVGLRGVMVSEGEAEGGRIPCIIHLYGDVDADWAQNRGMEVYPRKRGFPLRMTKTLDDLGPKVSIGLFTAGLRAAVALARNEGPGIQQDLTAATRQLGNQG